jgi:hypothetical protein
MAGAFNKYLSKTLKMLDTASGKSAKSWANKASVLEEAEKSGLTSGRARRKAKVEAGRTFQTRVKLGVGGAAVVGGGFLGLHKYMQHQDNKILARIDKLYGAPYNGNS